MSSKETSPTSSREQSPVHEDVSVNAISSAPAVDNRKQPWRSLPEFESVEDKVEVKKVKDMRLFGNHVNAHSWATNLSYSVSGKSQPKVVLHKNWSGIESS